METEKQTTNDTPVTTDVKPVDTPITTPETAPVVETPTVPETPVAPVETTVVVTEAAVTPAMTVTENAPATTEVVPATATSLPLKQYAIAAGVVLVIGGLLLFGLERQGRVDSNVFGSLKTMVQGEPAAAVVDGTKISLADYEKNRQQIIASAQQQGLDLTDATITNEINTQAIDVLVNTELLRKSAKAAGVVITPEQVETRYQEVITSVGSAELLAERMVELGIDEAGLRRDIEGELLIQTYLDDAVDTSSITVDEAEILAVYEQAGGAAAGLPPIEDVQAEIESQIRFTEEQELVNAFIQSLREEATIEILI